MTPLEVAAGLHDLRQPGDPLRAGFRPQRRWDATAPHSSPNSCRARNGARPAWSRTWSRASWKTWSTAEPGPTVRARGFRAPAAGKTGTSHDGWFAGFTSNLLCVVWVGFDDNRELGLEGTLPPRPSGPSSCAARRRCPATATRSRSRARTASCSRPSTRSRSNWRPRPVPPPGRKSSSPVRSRRTRARCTGSWKASHNLLALPRFRFRARRCRAGADGAGRDAAARCAQGGKKEKEGILQASLRDRERPGRPEPACGNRRAAVKARIMNTEVRRLDGVPP